MNDLDTFINRLVEDRFAGRTDIDADVMAQLKSDAADRAEDYINREILDHLPPEHLAEFNRLLDRDDEEWMPFLQRVIPNIDQVVAAGLVEFAKDYLGKE